MLRNHHVRTTVMSVLRKGRRAGGPEENNTSTTLEGSDSYHTRRPSTSRRQIRQSSVSSRRTSRTESQAPSRFKSFRSSRSMRRKDDDGSVSRNSDDGTPVARWPRRVLTRYRNKSVEQDQNQQDVNMSSSRRSTNIFRRRGAHRRGSSRDHSARRRSETPPTLKSAVSEHHPKSHHYHHSGSSRTHHHRSPVMMSYSGAVESAGVGAGGGDPQDRPLTNHDLYCPSSKYIDYTPAPAGAAVGGSTYKQHQQQQQQQQQVPPSFYSQYSPHPEPLASRRSMSPASAATKQALSNAPPPSIKQQQQQQQQRIMIPPTKGDVTGVGAAQDAPLTSSRIAKLQSPGGPNIGRTRPVASTPTPSTAVSPGSGGKYEQAPTQPINGPKSSSGGAGGGGHSSHRSTAATSKLAPPGGGDALGTLTPNTESTRATSSIVDESPPKQLSNNTLAARSPLLRNVQPAVGLLTAHGTPVDLTKFFDPLPWEPSRFKNVKRLAPAIHGEVRYVYDLVAKKSAVVKIIHNKAMRPREVGELENPLVEIGAMSYLFSDKAVYPVDMVANLEGVYQDSAYTYLVTEYCTDGELFREVVTRRFLPERHVKAIALQLALALNSLHKNGICHRDVSLENTLLQSDRSVRLIDFGQAECVYEADGKEKLMAGSAGKAYYRAPEMLRGTYYGPPADVFALGVQIFIMAVGSPPWQKATRNDARYRSLTKCPTGIDTALRKWEKRDKLSNHFVDLLASIFCPEPHERPTIEELLLHPWFAFDSEVWKWVFMRGCSKTIRQHAERVEKYLMAHPEGRYFNKPPTVGGYSNNELPMSPSGSAAAAAGAATTSTAAAAYHNHHNHHNHHHHRQSVRPNWS